MKTTKELLQLVLDHIKEAFELFTFYDGICLIPAYLQEKELITNPEYIHLRRQINSKISPIIDMSCDGWKAGYAWKPGVLEPRIKWLQGQINML